MVGRVMTGDGASAGPARDEREVPVLPPGLAPSGHKKEELHPEHAFQGLPGGIKAESSPMKTKSEVRTSERLIDSTTRSLFHEDECHQIWMEAIEMATRKICVAAYGLS